MSTAPPTITRAIEAALPEQPDRALHCGHGGGHQCAQAHQPAIKPLRLIHLPLAGHIFAKVDYIEPIVIQHHLHDILSDIVNIPFHRSEQDRAMLLRSGARLRAHAP